MPYLTLMAAFTLVLPGGQLRPDDLRLSGAFRGLTGRGPQPRQPAN
jgi:hypothetical protein